MKALILLAVGKRQKTMTDFEMATLVISDGSFACFEARPMIEISKYDRKLHYHVDSEELYDFLGAGKLWHIHRTFELCHKL